MRFHSNGPIIPDLLFQQCEEGNVVFFCGAGVSINSGMPSFVNLTGQVIDYFKPSVASQIMKAFCPWLNDVSGEKVPLDQIFHMLHEEYDKDAVNTVVTRILDKALTGHSVGKEHGWIKRISLNKCRKPQIVTTNFDLLFEHGEKPENLPVHTPPTLPDPTLGLPIGGIVYLHGRLSWPGTCDHNYILSSADFGMAYLSKGWAAKFINGLVENYTVVFVGYQAEDPPMKYLLQGLNWDGQFDQTRLFAFDKGDFEQIEAKWSKRGVTPIAYQDHNFLWETMEAWANRADNPRIWRRAIIRKTRQQPSAWPSHQRGQVAHILRSAPGAQLFAEFAPSPHPEWICVLDESTRTAKASYSYEEGAETFIPIEAYGLDDDIVSTTTKDYRHKVRNDQLIEWRPGDLNPPDFHRLTDRQIEGREAMPPRLQHIASWIVKLYSSPIIAWWAARQNGLHPQLIDRIDLELRSSNEVNDLCRRVWNLILEYHRDIRNRSIRVFKDDMGWNYLKMRLRVEGWTNNVLNEFRLVCRPRLDIACPMGLHMNKPPTADWNSLSLGDICRFQIEYLDYEDEDVDAIRGVSDEVLPTMFGILESHLSFVKRMVSEAEMRYLNTPTCYPDRETDGGEPSHNFAKPFRLFLELYDRLVHLNPDLARVRAMLWDERDRYFFLKFKLYALSKSKLFEANEVAHIIAFLDKDVFWDTNVVRELLFLLVDRWQDIPNKNRKVIEERILSGPNKRSHWSDKEFPDIRNQNVAMYGRYLQMRLQEKSHYLADTFATKLKKVIAEIPNWNDGWAILLVTLHGMHGGFVGTDETPDVLIGLRSSEIVPRAEVDFHRRIGSLTWKRPFIGLVKAAPRKALLSLIVESRNDSFPEFAWSALIREFPSEAPIRIYCVFLNRLTRLPFDMIAKLRYTVGMWLKTHLTRALQFDANLGWRVYDHFLTGILFEDQDVTKSSMDHTYHGNEIAHRTPRTFHHAINGPLGMLTEALLIVTEAGKPEPGSLISKNIKMRLEKLLTSTKEGVDHSTSILMSQLSWIMSVDPVWANERLIPMLAFKHDASEPAWNGLLNSQSRPSVVVTKIVKPLLLTLYPWIRNFDWCDDVSARAATWIASMCVFRHDKSDGLGGHEMRVVLRKMRDLERNQIIFWLGRVGNSNDAGWSDLVIPFINNAWPLELEFRTSASVAGWIRLMGNTKEYFPEVYESVKRFLVPVKIDNVVLYKFVREVGGEKPIAVQYPKVTLDLMNTLTSDKMSHPSHELSNVLALIAGADPDLTLDRQYLRLVDLIERT